LCYQNCRNLGINHPNRAGFQGQLGKGPAQELIQAAERADSVVAFVTVHKLTEFLQLQEIHDLGENRCGLIQRGIPFNKLNSG
jgi:hypothetical protein